MHHTAGFFVGPKTVRSRSDRSDRTRGTPTPPRSRKVVLGAAYVHLFDNNHQCCSDAEVLKALRRLVPMTRWTVDWSGSQRAMMKDVTAVNVGRQLSTKRDETILK